MTDRSGAWGLAYARNSSTISPEPVDLVEDLADAFTLPAGQRRVVLEQLRVDLDPAEGIAHLVGDPGDHRSQGAVPFRQSPARLIERSRKKADLIGTSDADRRVEIPGAHRPRSRYQLSDRPRQAPRQPDAQERREEEADAPTRSIFLRNASIS